MTTISALPAATTLAPADVFAIDQSGVTKKITSEVLFGNLSTPVVTSADITMTGVSRRFIADFSNATHLSRFLFKTTTVDSATSLGVIPSGSSRSANIIAWNREDPTNAGYAQLAISDTKASIRSGYIGTGNWLPLTLETVGAEKFRIEADSTGTFTFGGTAPRIIADFNNATLPQRLMFTAAAAGAINFHIIGNGAGSAGGYKIEDGALLTTGNSSVFAWDLIPGSHAQITSGIRGTGTYLPLTINVGNFERFRIDTTGNIGIGISTPGAKLHVKGNLNQGIGIGGEVQLSGAACIAAVNDAYSANIPMELRYGTTVAWFDSGTERMRLSGSNLGIGVVPTASVGLLQVSGTAFATSYFRVGAVGSTAYSGGIENASNTSKSISIEADPTNAGANSLILFKIDGSAKMQMTATGLTTYDYAANNQYSASFSARKVGAGLEFGHWNTAGYGGVIGAHTSGTPYLGFNCGPGTAANSYRTYGLKGSVITSDLAGGFIFGSANVATQDDQSLTERFRIDGAGAISYTATSVDNTSTADYSPQHRLAHIGSTAGSGPYSILRRARAGTAAVVNGDYLGTFLFSGYDGSTWDTSAYIFGHVDSTVSAGSVPTAITICTGATTPTERLRVASDGRIYVAGFATRPNGSQLQVNTSITCYGLHTAATSAISVGSVTCHDTSSTWQSLNMYYHGSTESGYLDYCPTVPKALAAELIAVNSNALVITTNTGPVVIGTQATERLRLDAGGYFGVGTAGAIANTYDQVASQRHVFVGSSTATTVANGTGGVAIVNSATTTNNLSSLAFAARTGSNLNYFASGHIQVQHGARVDGQYHAGTMIFSVAAGSNLAPTERLRIESNGNITNANTTATVGGKAFTWNNSDTGAGSYVQHVVSTNAGSFITQIGSTANGGLASLYSSASGGMMFYTTNATSLSLGTNNVSSRLVLNSSGGVTVGAKGTAGVLRLEAMNGVAEGGEMSFGGASTYPDIGMDNYAGTLRTSNIGGVRSILVDDGNFQFGNTPAVNTLRYFDIYNVDTGVNTGTNLRFITKNAANSATVAVDLVKYRSGAFYITNNEPSSTGVINLGAYSATQVQIVPVSGALNYIKFSGSVSGNPTISTNAGNLAITPNIDAAGSVNSGVAADPVVKNYYSTCTQSAVATEWGGYYHANAGHATSTLKATARFVMNYTSNRNASTNTQAVGIINSVTGAYDVSLLQGLSVSVGATAAFTTGKVIGNATGLQVGMTNDGVGLITNVIGVAIGDYVTTTGTPILGGGVYGLYSTISSGAGRWNIYSIGTAASYHAGEFQFARNMTMLSVNAGTFNAGDWSRDANWGTYYKGFAGTVANVAFVNNAGTAIWGVGAKGAGYFAGSGGAVAQGTSRTTSVTLNKVCGSIVLVTAAGTTAWQQFTVSNSMVEANDVIIVNYKDTLDLYEMHVKDVAAGSFKIAYRTTGGTTVEEPIFHFAVIKAVTL